MSRATIFKLAAMGVFVLPLLALDGPEPAPVGPPWLSIEFPANPMDPATRGAALVVHAFHHERPVGFAVTGTAEGLVHGERRTLELKFKQTSSPGVYALSQQWPSEGAWLLNLSTGAHADVSLIVELGPDGGVKASRFYDWSVPSLAIRTARVVQGSVDPHIIDSYLQQLARSTD